MCLHNGQEYRSNSIWTSLNDKSAGFVRYDGSEVLDGEGDEVSWVGVRGRLAPCFPVEALALAAVVIHVPLEVLFNLISFTSTSTSFKVFSYQFKTPQSIISRVLSKFESKPCMKQRMRNPSSYGMPLLVQVQYIRRSRFAKASKDSSDLMVCWVSALYMVDADDFDIGCLRSIKWLSISIPRSSYLGLLMNGESVWPVRQRLNRPARFFDLSALASVVVLCKWQLSKDG